MRVTFENGVWPERELPSYAVRRCPRNDDLKGFRPKIDTAVEAHMPISELHPSGWALGRVRATKKSFFFVTLAGKPDSVHDIIVEGTCLRPVSDEPCIDTEPLVRRTVPVVPELHAWVSTDDFADCLGQTQRRSGLLLVDALRSGETQAREPQVQVLLVGGDRAVELAQNLLVLIHFKHQLEMRRFQKCLEKLHERMEAFCTDSFEVEPQLTSRIRGRARELGRSMGVQVRLEAPCPAPDGSLGPARVFLSGSSTDVVRQARRELEYVRDRIPLASEQVSQVLGRSYEGIQNVARDTNLQYLRLDDGASCLELCGLRHQVEAARARLCKLCPYLATTTEEAQEDRPEHAASGAIGYHGRRRSGRGRGKGWSGRGMGKGRGHALPVGMAA